jgi:AcrR family transcriptional regulator
MTSSTRARGRVRAHGSADDQGSTAQRERRRRILDATLALASKGGFDAVQMRAVAERAEVALGTLYRYFPSKIHLLVSALARELERTQDRIDRAILHGDTPYDRLMVVLGGITKAMQRDPHLTEAMTRAFMFADASAAAEAEAVGRLMDHMFARAMSNGDPTDEQLAIARVISDVWLSNLVAWVTRRASATDVANRLELTVGLLLGRRRAADAF